MVLRDWNLASAGRAFQKGKRTMASISQEQGRNGFRLSFYGLDKRKRSMWLGGFSRRQATTVKTNVEHLLVSRAAGDTPDVHVARWLGSIGPDLRKKLITAELIEPTAEDRGPATLGPFLADYETLRSDVKESTLLQYRCAIRSLVGFFGADKRLDEITSADAERWRIHVRKHGSGRENDPGWSDNTTRRIAGRCRQFFQHGVKLKLIDENPFTGFSVAVHGNTKRQHFVSRAVIQTALDECSCAELRAVIALSRYAGIRVPSEVVSLTWQDVDLEARRLTIRAQKTEHHEDGGLRFCPIFPELLPFLRELHNRAQPGINCPMSTPVISRWRSSKQNLRTAFRKLLIQAGIKPWEKLYHNMRASRQTELLAEFPAADVCDWLGNSQAVAMKHYAMATSDSFERAVCGSTGGSISADQEPSGAGPETTKPSKTTGFEGFSYRVTTRQAPRKGPLSKQCAPIFARSDRCNLVMENEFPFSETQIGVIDR